MARPRWSPLVLLLAACESERTPEAPRVDPGAAPIPAVWVAVEGSIVAHSLDTGEPGGLEVGSITSPSSMIALEDGILLVSLTEIGRLAAVDGRFMKERERWISSEVRAVRPQGASLGRLADGTLAWAVSHTGRPGDEDDSTIALVDVDPDHQTRFSKLGELGVPRGPHAHAMSDGGRLVVAAQGSCDRTVLEFAVGRVKDGRVERRLSAAQLGFEGGASACDPATGTIPAPLGCASVAGSLACAVGPFGRVGLFDASGAPPVVVATGGRGAGAVAPSPDGALLLVVEASPREGDGGVACQIGQLAVIDPGAPQPLAAIPLLLDGPGCTRSLSGTDEASLRPGAIWAHAGTGRLFVGLDATAPGARGRHLLVLEGQGATIAQAPSLELPASDGPAIGALSLGAHWLVIGRPLVRQVVKVDPLVPEVALSFPTRAAVEALAASRDPAREEPR